MEGVGHPVEGVDMEDDDLADCPQVEKPKKLATDEIDSEGKSCTS